MSLVTYTNYTSFKPVAKLNAKVNKLIKKTKKVEEKPEYKFFPMNAHKRIKLPPPTFDMKKEVVILKDIIARRTPEDETSIRLHDEHSFYAIEQYCKENGLEFHYDEMKQIVDQARPTIKYFKDTFDVPRPHEVDRSIRPMSSVTNKSRSYPSGHATQSMLIALYVSEKFPEHEKGIKEAAKECGLGRVKAGFHYLADYVAGNLLAEKMFMIMNRENYGKYVNESPRVPRKKGQPAGSDKHSDLYTDENPKGTIHGLGFKDVETAKSSVKKIESSGKSHAHKIQAAIAMEQRARVMGKTAEANIYRAYIEKMKKITKQKNEDFTQKDVNDLEKFADRILKKYNIDVEFTRHFVDRLNDPRNSPAIKVSELQKFFKKIQRNKGANIRSNPDVEAVLKDMSTNLNLPVVIKTKGDDSFEVTNKTIMRKKDFKTTSKVINYA